MRFAPASTVLSVLTGTLAGCLVHATAQPSADAGLVSVQGNVLLRDGRPWVPHGYYQIAFEVAPGNLARADHPFWGNAFRNYSPDEYSGMRALGADSVRIQIAQAAADPQSPLFDREFVAKAVGAVRAARQAGLSVIVAVQDESHVPGETAIDLPDEGTRRVWRRLAPEFASDRGILLELLNEPRPQPSPQNWRRWQESMMAAAAVVRRAGAANVLVADGLGVGQVLDGAPLLPDPQVVYASHPYALGAPGQTRDMWERKFGAFSRRAPVIITEWISGGYFCDDNTAQSTLDFFRYLQNHRIGLEMGVWDWASGGFGSARYGFPNGQSSTFVGLRCHEKGFGSGKLIEAWYRTSTPPAELK